MINRQRTVAEPAVMQREHERSRTVVDGRRTDDGTLCKLIAVHEIGGDWVLYPHGWTKFGVRLPKTDAIQVAEAILAGTQ